MNPCFNAIDFGREYQHIGRIFPFKDRPDIGIRVLWFPVPLDSPYVPFPNPFVLRTWDKLESLPQTPLGTDQEYREPYSGPLPTNSPGRVCGSADQWLNGLSYETYIRGGYACGCPEPIFMSVVNSVDCPDGSLVVSPHVGDVLVSIDSAHQNDWLTRQTFKSSNVVNPAVEIRGLTGQTAPYQQTRRSTGQLVQALTPGTGEIDAVFSMLALDGTAGFSVDTSGSMVLRNPATNCQERVTVTSEVNRAVFFGDLRNRYSTAHNEGYATFADMPGGNMAGTIDACVNCVRVPGGSNVVFSACDDATLGGNTHFQVYGGLTAGPDSFVGVNSALGLVQYAMMMNKRKDAFGLAILQDVAGASTNPPFALCDHLGAPLSGWNEDGTLFTSGTIAPAAIPTLQARWPLYNAAGSLIGYIPIMA